MHFFQVPISEQKSRDSVKDTFWGCQQISHSNIGLHILTTLTGRLQRREGRSQLVSHADHTRA